MTATRLREALGRHLSELDAMGPEGRITDRYEKFRAMGRFLE